MRSALIARRAASGRVTGPFDTFTRADSASSLGTSDSGHTYTALGTWGISSNKAYCTALSAGNAYATLDVGATDMDVTATLGGTLAGNPGILARYTDSNNFLRLLMTTATNVRLDQLIGGVFTNLGQVSVSLPSPSVFRLVVAGSTATCYVNGVQVESLTTTLLTGTHAGLFHNAVNAVRFDDLTIV